MVCTSSNPIIPNIFLYSIERFNDDEFIERFALSNPDLKIFLHWMFNTRCAGVVKLADTGQQKERRRDGLEMGMTQFLSLL